jgi:hypothetical protein
VGETSAASGAGGPLRSIGQLRHLAELSDRIAGVERRLAEVERRLASPECDGTALEAVRDAVRELGTEVTEGLNRLAAERGSGPAQG